MTSPARGRLRAPRAMQSWPGIVHGGAVVALLDAAARSIGVARGPRVLEGRLTASLPLETDLAVAAEPWEDGVTLTVLGDGHVLSSGTIRPRAAPVGDDVCWPGGGRGEALPMSDHCLACGAVNPLGLHARLRFDATGVWTHLTPGPGWLGADGDVEPAVAPVLLDEVAWWLGALVAGEGGLTNRIDVTLLTSAIPAGPLVAAGRLADVTPIDRKRTFWRAACALMTPAGALLATGSVVFRGGAEYSRLQMEYFRARTDRAVFRRMFPSQGG